MIYTFAKSIFCRCKMTDLVNNVVALRINSRDRVNINDSTTDFTVALRKSLRNIAGINIAGVVIPRNDTLIGPNNDTLSGEIRIDNIINPFEVMITRSNYNASTLATELQTQINANTDMLSYGITFAISFVPLTNRMDIVATYPLGATKTWSLVIDFTSLRDVIGIGIAGTTPQTFAATAGSTTVNITSTRAPNLARALTYNITSSALTNSINTSYISSLGKFFQITSANNTLGIDSRLTSSYAIDLTIIITPGITPELFSQMMIGSTVDINNTGTMMVVGSRRYGVYIFTRATTTSEWLLMGNAPVRRESTLYYDTGYSVAVSGDGSTIAYSSSFQGGTIFERSGSKWVLTCITGGVGGTAWWLSFNIDGSTFAIGHNSGSGNLRVFKKTNGSWNQQISIPLPGGSVSFGSGVDLSNTGDNLITCDSGYGSVVAYTYLRTGNIWALQQTLVPGTAVGGFIDGVTMSGNGLYLAISSSTDNAGVGATWIYNWTGATWNEQQKISVASTSIALNIVGDTIVIGASSGAGNVSVYKRTGVLWSAELTGYVGTSGNPASNQGMSVAITGAGDDIIWSGPNDPGFYGNNQGAVWSGHRITATWSQTLGKITSTIGVMQPLFGKVLAMSDDGTTLAAGFPDVDTQSGIAYIYTATGITWALQETFNPRPGAGARIGGNVALSTDGNTFAVSGHSDVPNGGVWIYVRANGIWSLQAQIVSSTSPIMSQGRRIALNGPGNTLVISGDQDGLLILDRVNSSWVERETNFGAGVFGNNPISRLDISNDETTIVASSASFGAVVYKLINSTWTQVGANFLSFYAPGTANVNFGKYCCISADGNTIAISDPNDNTNDGVTFIFKYVSNVWTQNATLPGPIGSSANQGFALALLNNGNRCVTTSPTFGSNSGTFWMYEYNGASWSQIYNPGTTFHEFGYSVSGQRTSTTFAVGTPCITNPGGLQLGFVNVYSYPGTIYTLSNQVVIPEGEYTIFDLVNKLKSLLIDVIPTGNPATFSGYTVAFDGISCLTLTPILGYPITGVTFRVATSSTFNVARWSNQEYKTSQVSNPISFSINSNVIKSITTHSDNSDNVLVDNTPDTPYRKYPAGYTIDAGTPIDIQLRNDRDQIIDLNGSDWVMTVYATVRS